MLKAVHQIVESCSSIMSVEERYAEIGGYNTTMTIVTVEPGGLTVGGDSYSNKTRLLVVCSLGITICLSSYLLTYIRIVIFCNTNDRSLLSNNKTQNIYTTELRRTRQRTHQLRTLPRPPLHSLQHNHTFLHPFILQFPSTTRHHNSSTPRHRL